jgi:hypothetical protein
MLVEEEEEEDVPVVVGTRTRNPVEGDVAAANMGAVVVPVVAAAVAVAEEAVAAVVEETAAATGISLPLFPALLMAMRNHHRHHQKCTLVMVR